LGRSKGRFDMQISDNYLLSRKIFHF